MKILITLEDHLSRAPDGHIYGNGPEHYSTWSELLGAFDKVILLSRVSRSNDFSLQQNRFDGPSISVHELPNYSGPWQYLRELSSLRIAVRQAVAECDVYLLRVPGLVSRLAWREIGSHKRTYAAEAMGDPADALSPGTMRSLFRPFYRYLAIRSMRRVCGQANAVLYWNKGSLPLRYPPAKFSYSAFSPRIILTQGYVSNELMTLRSVRVDEIVLSNNRHSKPLRLGFIGSFAQLYKGADTLLRAASLCSQNGLELRIFFVGEGRYRPSIQALAAELLIQESANFMGQLPFGKPIFDFLDSVDIFVMPSRCEGLPRALVEAMARGCPCIGSTVGGIPELLAPEDLVPPNNPEALAQKIMEVTANPQRMKEMSERNLARAKQFDPEGLREARLAFYRYVREHSGNNAKSGREQQSTIQSL